ncbi:23550_t:CDS:1, partial [Cetraspora pellucida]
MPVNILNIADELLITIFEFTSSPNDFKNLAISCKKFSNVSKIGQTRAKWILCQYGKAHALFHAVRLGPTFINLSVATAIIASGAILSRYFIQRLFTHFGSCDQKLIDIKTAYNTAGRIDINKIKNSDARTSWASNLQISVFSYLISTAQEQLKTDDLWVRGDDMELFLLLSGGFEHVINHAHNILLENINNLQNLILKMKFIPFPQRMKHVQENLNEYPAKDGYENNRQLNGIVRSILIYKDLVHLWKQIGYHEICKDMNDLVMKGALLLLFPSKPFVGWARPTVQDVNKRLMELIELGFQLNYNVINYIFHRFEHRLKDIGSILMESFMHVHEKPLALSPIFYDWVLKRLGSDERMIALCFEDLLKTCISLETQLQKSKAEVSIDMNQCKFKAVCDIFKVYCNAKKLFLPSHLEVISKSTSHEIHKILFDNYLVDLFNEEISSIQTINSIGDPDISQMSPSKKKGNTQIVKEWEKKLTNIYYQLKYEENRMTNTFRDYLSKFVEE